MRFGFLVLGDAAPSLVENITCSEIECTLNDDDKEENSTLYYPGNNMKFKRQQQARGYLNDDFTFCNTVQPYAAW